MTASERLRELHEGFTQGIDRGVYLNAGALRDALSPLIALVAAVEEVSPHGHFVVSVLRTMTAWQRKADEIETALAALNAKLPTA